jgi:hypothetical protein
MPFREPRLSAALETAMTYRNIAAHRARELRARLGYLISPEQARALDELEMALEAALDALAGARAETARMYEEQRR